MYKFAFYSVKFDLFVKILIYNLYRRLFVLDVIFA